MTKAIYPKAKQAMLSGGVNLLTGVVKIALIDVSGTDYTYNAADEFLSDVPSGAIIDISEALSGKSVSNGVFESADAAVLGVSGDIFEGLLFFIDTGVEATSRLIAFEDEDIDGAPATPDGGNFEIEMPTDGWFAL